jgi:hypothetical protein
VAREAARLRWELARLRSRRSVRAALLAHGAAGARHGGPRDVWATLKGRRVVEDLDVIAPATVTPPRALPPPRRRAPGATRPSTRRAPPPPHRQDPDAVRRQPPDLVVLDEPAALAGWSQHGAPRRCARRCRPPGAVVAVVSTADAAEVATGRWTSRCAPRRRLGSPRRDAGLPFGVDPLVDNPIGWHRTPQRVPPRSPSTTAWTPRTACRWSRTSRTPATMGARWWSAT